MATTPANLTITNSNGDYALGYTNSEHDRSDPTSRANRPIHRATIP